MMDDAIKTITIEELQKRFDKCGEFSVIMTTENFKRLISNSLKDEDLIEVFYNKKNRFFVMGGRNNYKKRLERERQDEIQNFTEFLIDEGYGKTQILNLIQKFRSSERDGKK